MSKVRIGVLRGGPSSEFEVSLETGRTILENLPTDKYTAQDILIDREGNWFARGLQKNPKQILNNLDAVFVALHGAYGEDGQVQRLLEDYRIPYTGSRSIESAICLHKSQTREIIKPLGLTLAHAVQFTVEDHIPQIIDRFMQAYSEPWVVKPVASGSSIGVTIAHNREQIFQGIGRALEQGPEVLLEQFIPGREATCAVIQDLRDSQFYTPLPVEIIPDVDQVFFDYDAKYNGKSRELCPGHFSREESEYIQRIARRVHKHLNLRHYSRSDFILGQDGKTYFLEVNTLPSLAKESLVQKSLTAVGIDIPYFLDHITSLALQGK